jgi:hypothetical protein
MDWKRSALLAATLAAAMVVVAVPVAQAQQNEPSPKGQTQPPARAVEDHEIKSFAAAASEVEQLNRAWLPKLQAAAQQGREEEMKARQQAMAEMTLAVNKNGLSVERYEEILQVAMADPEVKRKVLEQMPGAN